MRGPIFLGVAFSLTTAAWCTPITGTFHDGGSFSWSFQGAGISFQTVQGQTSFVMTTCFSGQPCDVAGSFLTFFGGEGSANLNLGNLQLTDRSLSGEFTWSLPPLILHPSDLQGPSFHLVEPVQIQGHLDAFADASRTSLLAAFSFTGEGVLELTDFQGAISPGQWVAVVGDGGFSGELTIEQNVPEPAAAVLLLAGIVVLAVRRRIPTG
jgi:hypothetical protein